MRVHLPHFAALIALTVALATGCGGDDEPAENRGAGGRAEQPYPPQAAEPAQAPPVEGSPAGRVVRVGGPAEGLAVDPDTGLVAVALQDPPRLVLVDGESGELRRRVDLPSAPRHIELARPGGPVLVPTEEDDSLVQVDLPSGETTRTRVGDHPHDAAFLDGRAYTVDEFGSTLTEVTDGRRTRQVPVDAQPGGVVAVGDRLGVVSVRAYTFELYEPGDLSGTGSQSAGVGPTHVTADADGRAYIADTRGDAVTVFATSPRLQWKARVPLEGAPYGIAADTERRRVWVALSGRNELVELNTGDKPSRRRTLRTVRQPNSVAADTRSGRVFVASATDDALQIIDP